jgi:hypothetical protein
MTFKLVPGSVMMISPPWTSTWRPWSFVIRRWMACAMASQRSGIVRVAAARSRALSLAKAISIAKPAPQKSHFFSPELRTFAAAFVGYWSPLGSYRKVYIVKPALDAFQNVSLNAVLTSS